MTHKFITYYYIATIFHYSWIDTNSPEGKKLQPNTATDLEDLTFVNLLTMKIVHLCRQASIAGHVNITALCQDWLVLRLGWMTVVHSWCRKFVLVYKQL